MILMKQLTFCTWSEPGSNPYTGTPEDALFYLGYPPEIREKFLEQLKDPNLRYHQNLVEFSWIGIRSYPHDFLNDFSMTFGENTVCHHTKAVESTGNQLGLLLEQDGYFLAIPFICNNYTRLYAYETAPGIESLDRKVLVDEPSTGVLLGVVLVLACILKYVKLSDYSRGKKRSSKNG